MFKVNFWLLREYGCVKGVGEYQKLNSQVTNRRINNIHGEA